MQKASRNMLCKAHGFALQAFFLHSKMFNFSLLSFNSPSKRKKMKEYKVWERMNKEEKMIQSDEEGQIWENKRVGNL